MTMAKIRKFSDGEYVHQPANKYCQSISLCVNHLWSLVGTQRDIGTVCKTNTWWKLYMFHCQWLLASKIGCIALRSDLQLCWTHHKTHLKKGHETSVDLLLAMPRSDASGTPKDMGTLLAAGHHPHPNWSKYGESLCLNLDLEDVMWRCYPVAKSSLW